MPLPVVWQHPDALAMCLLHPLDCCLQSLSHPPNVCTHASWKAGLVAVAFLLRLELAQCFLSGCRSTHLVGYGAQYYSYLYAKCTAAAVWRQYFAADPFDRDAGTPLLLSILLSLSMHRTAALALQLCTGCTGVVLESWCGADCCNMRLMVHLRLKCCSARASCGYHPGCETGAIGCMLSDGLSRMCMV